MAAYDRLYGFLCRELARQRATPEARLLDDVLAALGEEAGAPDYGERRRRAQSLMREAFTGGERA